jgi:hypothetical protein
MTAFRDVSTWSMLKIDRRFRGAYFLFDDGGIHLSSIQDTVTYTQHFRETLQTYIAMVLYESAQYLRHIARYVSRLRLSLRGVASCSVNMVQYIRSQVMAQFVRRRFWVRRPRFSSVAAHEGYVVDTKFVQIFSCPLSFHWYSLLMYATPDAPNMAIQLALWNILGSHTWAASTLQYCGIYFVS